MGPAQNVDIQKARGKKRLPFGPSALRPGASAGLKAGCARFTRAALRAVGNEKTPSYHDLWAIATSTTDRLEVRVIQAPALTRTK